MSIQGIPAIDLTQAHASEKTPAQAKAHKVALEFESLLVRQLLQASKVGGQSSKGSGYGDMAIDALTSGIAQGGGLGLARQIEDSISRAEMKAK